MADLKRTRHPDTIAAIATAPGAAALGIVRLSGPDALEVADRIFLGERKPLKMKGFEAAYGWVVAGEEKLDEVVLLVMRAPQSYTREDMVEITCHGGPVTLRAVLDAALAAGARLALPGEFTRRAFLNGRIDLSQAEAVAALIASETEVAARAALRGVAGELGSRIDDLRLSLLEALALLEAGLDFAGEDIEFIPRDKLKERMQDALARLEKIAAAAKTGKILSAGVRVTIAGRPNVGKSTLMNALLERDRVIVTPHPGTTRDVIEETVNLGGAPVRISDTAGMREAQGEIEREGIERTRKAIAEADLVLVVLDGSAPITDYDLAILAETKDRERILVVNKIDLPLAIGALENVAAESPTKISAKSGQGIKELREKIIQKIWKGRAATEDALVSTARQLGLLSDCSESLRSALSTEASGLSEEFIASSLRRAIEALSQLTGQTISEDALEIIFSKFCVGK